MKNDTGKTVRSLLIAGVVVMAVSIMWPLLAEKYGNRRHPMHYRVRLHHPIYHRLHRHQHQHQNQR